MKIRLETSEKGMSYSVWRRGKTVVEPTRFSLEVEERGVLNGARGVRKRPRPARVSSIRWSSVPPGRTMQ